MFQAISDPRLIVSADMKCEGKGETTERWCKIRFVSAQNWNPLRYFLIWSVGHRSTKVAPERRRARGETQTEAPQIAVPLAAADIIGAASNLFQVSPQWSAIVAPPSLQSRRLLFFFGLDGSRAEMKASRAGAARRADSRDVCVCVCERRWN